MKEVSNRTVNRIIIEYESFRVDKIHSFSSKRQCWVWRYNENKKKKKKLMVEQRIAPKYGHNLPSWFSVDDDAMSKSKYSQAKQRWRQRTNRIFLYLFPASAWSIPTWPTLFKIWKLYLLHYTHSIPYIFIPENPISS